ncbi:MAG: copper resistance protein CopC/CopD, partial [Thermomicrobiales bacterium]|nr:copper resistance protein CopC/CopD [Thermomicrobiales bacterium]
MRQPHATTRLRARARSLTTIVAALLFAWSFVGLNPPSAEAHARLIGSTPISGSALAAMPTEITLDFSEEIDPLYSSANLLDASGNAAAIEPLTASDDRRTVTIRLAQPSPPPGTYTLVWRVLSAVDGHVTTGTVAFSAGTGVAPEAAGGAEIRPPWWRIAFRWIELGGLVIVTGLFAFAIAIARRALSDLPAHSILAARVVLASAAIAHLVAGYDLGITAAARRFRDPPALSVYRDLVSDSTGGRSWLSIAVCLGILAVLTFARPTSRWPGLIGLAAGLAALYTTSAAGHAAAVAPAWRSVLIDWLHFAAVACWLGTLAILWFALRMSPETDEAPRWVARFSRLGVVLLGTIVVSGVLRAAAEVSGPRNLAQSDYGRTLIAKHLLFVVVLVAAGVNQLILMPKIRQAIRRDLPATAIVASIQRFAAIEVAAASFMLLASAALTELAPADAPLAVDVAARPLTINQRASAGDLTVWVLARLEGSNGDRFTITVADAEGNPPADLQRVIVQSSTAIDGAVAGDRFDAEPFAGTAGTYVFPAIRLGLPGSWDLAITVRRAGVEDVSAAMSIDTTGAGSPAPRLAEDEWRWPRPTLPAWLLGLLAMASLLGGVAAVKVLRGIEPFAAGIILTMTALIAGGFAVQGYRQTIPVSAGTDLVNPIPADAGS